MAEAAMQHPGHDFSNLPVGEILRRTRVHYKQSIKDVEKSLRIRAEQIQAIEDNNIEKLPARVYAIGFVRSYADYLGLDGEKMVELFKHQSADKAANPELHFPIAASESKAPPLWLAIFSLFVLACVIGFWLHMKEQQRQAIETIPEVPAALKPKVLEEQAKPKIEEPPPPPVEEEIAAPSPEPAPKGITLNINENSWVEIRDVNRRVVLSRVLNAGEEYFVPDRENLTMSIGNARGVSLKIDGIALKSLGEKGQVIRNMPLNAEALKQRFRKPVETQLENQ